jgi:hypothetical protein
MGRSLRLVVLGFIEAMDFTEREVGDNDEMVLSYGLLRACYKDCKMFLDASEGIESDGWGDVEFGNDIWFTRNGHGVGFWDRGRPNSDRLTEVCDGLFREMEVYKGDDGIWYC